MPLAILRAVAEKLVPGIPRGTRIAILQQNILSNDKRDDIATTESYNAGGSPNPRSVIEDVVDRAVSRDHIQREIDS